MWITRPLGGTVRIQRQTKSICHKKIIKSIYLSCYHGRFYTTNYFQIIFILSLLVFIVFIFERKYLKCFNYSVMNKLFMLSSGVYQFEETHQWLRTLINSKLIQLHMLINMCGFCSPAWCSFCRSLVTIMTIQLCIEENFKLFKTQILLSNVDTTINCCIISKSYCPN